MLKFFTKRKSILLLVISFLHSWVLIGLSYYFLSQPVAHWDEGEVMGFFSIIKNIVIKADEVPEKKELCFINVENNYQLVDIYDEDGFPAGNIPITDREKLGKLFQMINKKGLHQFILCDINFDYPSSKDSLLAAEIKRTKRLKVSYHLDEFNNPKYPVFDAPVSLSDYEFHGGGFLKYKYFYNDSIKTTPLAIYEAIHGKEVTNGTFFMHTNGACYLETFVPELRIRSWELQGADSIGDATIPVVNLNDFFAVPDDEFIQALVEDYIKDKIVIIGALTKDDIHGTLLGDMPGPLILFNTYLSLKRGDNKITWRYILFIILSYTFISYLMFRPQGFLKEQISNFIEKSKLKKYGLQFIGVVVGYMSFFALFGLTAMFSYFFFGIHLSFILVVIYAQIVNWLVGLIYKKNQGSV